MAITEAQKDSVFEILQLPRATSIDMPTDDGKGLTGQTYTQSNIEFQLSTKVEARINALTTEQQTRLISYINGWEALGTSIATIDGNLGSIVGISFDPEKEEAKITERVKRLLCVYQYREEIMMNSAQNRGSGRIIPVIQ